MFDRRFTVERCSFSKSIKISFSKSLSFKKLTEESIIIFSQEGE